LLEVWKQFHNTILSPYHSPTIMQQSPSATRISQILACILHHLSQKANTSEGPILELEWIVDS
jgi:hypothetical protein